MFKRGIEIWGQSKTKTAYLKQKVWRKSFIIRVFFRTIQTRSSVLLEKFLSSSSSFSCARALSAIRGISRRKCGTNLGHRHKNMNQTIFFLYVRLFRSTAAIKSTCSFIYSRIPSHIVHILIFQLIINIIVMWINSFIHKSLGLVTIGNHARNFTLVKT